MSEHQRMPPETLTFVIRDDAPLVCLGDRSRFRTVRIRLTFEQRKALMLNGWWNSGRVLWEEVSNIIIETPLDQPEKASENEA